LIKRVSAKVEETYLEEIVLIVVFIVIAVVLVGGVSFLRMRRGGPGPAVNWVPRSMRGRVNKSYEQHGWQQPFDGDGDRNQNRDEI
jgi:hypothetical protein